MTDANRRAFARAWMRDTLQWLTPEQTRDRFAATIAEQLERGTVAGDGATYALAVLTRWCRIRQMARAEIS